MLTSIRSRLLLVVLLLLLLAAGIIVVTSLENRQVTLQQSASRLQHLANEAKKDLEVSIKHAHRMHFILQENTHILLLQDPACSHFLQKTVALSNEVSALSIWSMNGHNLCIGSEIQPITNLNIADRDFFKHAIVSNQVIVDLPTQGGPTGKYSLPVAGLIHNAQGKNTGVLVINIDLDVFSQKVAQELSDQKTIIELLDGTSNITFHFPHSPALMTAPTASLQTVHAALSPIKEWGLFEDKNANGGPEIMALSTQIGISKNTQLVISVGMKKADFYRPAEFYLWQALFAVVALLAFGIGAIWILGNRLIFQPVKQLLAVAKRLSAGDFSAHIGAPYANNEIGALARTMDHMADATAQFLLESKDKNKQLDQRVVERTAELEVQKNRLALALEVGQLGMWDKDLKTDRISSSPQHAMAFGYSELPKDWNIAIFLAHVTSDDRERVQIAYQAAIQSGYYCEEFRVQWQDGSIHWLSDMGRVIFDDDGQAQRMIGVISENSTKKIIETTLIANEKRFRQILEAGADGILITDLTGKIVYVNRQTEIIFGYERTALLGEVVEVLLPQRFQRTHVTQRQQYSQKPVRRVMGDRTLIGRRQDGSEFPAELAMCGVELDGQEMVIATIRDISALAQSKKEIIRLNRTLQVLSQCNETLVRVDDKTVLLTTICDTLVKIGNYPAAWVVLKGENNNDRLRIAAVTNNKNTIISINDDSLSEHSKLAARIQAVIDSGEAEITSQIDEKDFFVSWRPQADNSPFTAFAIVPLLSKSVVCGVLLLQSEEENPFDQKEITLLEKLADNVAYGLTVLQEKVDRQFFENKLHYQENFDALTGLANHNLFLDRLAQNMQNDKRNDKMIAVLIFNIDRFQVINDSNGHRFGDKLIQLLAQRLSALLREGDTVGRLSSSDFGIILSKLAIFEDIMVAVNKIMLEIESSFSINNSTLLLTASMGVSIFPKDADQAEILLKHADLAMQTAKRLGGNRFQYYSTEINSLNTRRMTLETNLSTALKQQELAMYFQPKLSLKTGKIIGAEALIRWPHPTLGMIPPSDFISLAEETGLILSIGAWTLASSCEHIRTWLDMGIHVPPVSVNLSPLQFRDEHLIEMISQTISKYKISPALLLFEITESTAMMDVEKGILILTKLKSLGFKLSIDDFGTGYSSLSYLKRLPLDQLKIDRAFVKDISSDANDRAICLAIIGLAHTLKMSVVAEGVETEAQMHILRQHHCDEIQGYLFSEALPAPEFAECLLNNRVLSLPDLTPAKLQTILLVDDEQNILSALKRLLRRDGYHILTATGGAEGLEILALNEVDVIISDQRMPGMIGADFLRRAKELYPSTVRIMLSGYTELQSVTDAVNEGAIYKFLTKPWEDELLRVHIQEAFKLKGIYDENKDLNKAIVIANNELELANHKMETILEQKIVQISRTEESLHIVREVLQKIPIAVIGVDDEFMIAFVNVAAESLFHDIPLLGCTVNEVLPDLTKMMTQNDPHASIIVTISGQSYCAVIHSMNNISKTEMRSKLIIFQPEVVLH